MVMLLIIFLSEKSFGIGERFGRGTKAIGLANAFVSYADNVWSLYYNTAGLQSLENIESSIFYVPNQFGLKELQQISFALAVPVSPLSVGCGIETFGFELYRETQITTGIAFQLTETVWCGNSLNIYHLMIQHYGESTLISGDMGILLLPFESISLGFAMKNIVTTKCKYGKESVPSIVSMGITYCSPFNMTMSFELEKEYRFPVSVKYGIEKKIFDVVALRGGFMTEPSVFSVGCEFYIKMCSVGYAGYNHKYLGWTNQFEVTVRL